ncbi:MAG: type II toxin-antitoxin system RelE/ParE family toxin [Nanoarchaeota archaeon]
MYPVEFSEYFNEILRKLKKKDPSLAMRLMGAMGEVAENPEHYKPLRNILKGKRRKHIGHYVLMFSFECGVVRMEGFAHHDDAY